MTMPTMDMRNPFAHLNRPRMDADPDNSDKDDVQSDDVADDSEYDEQDENDKPSSKGRLRAKSRGRADEDPDDLADDETQDDDDVNADEDIDEDEGDVKSDEDDEDDPKVARARARERRRCAYIFRSKAAARNPAAAAQIAFGTTMPRRQAVALLTSLTGVEAPTQQTKRGRAGAYLRDRMRSAPVPAVGQDRATGRQRPGDALLAAANKYSSAPRGR